MWGDGRGGLADAVGAEGRAVCREASGDPVGGEDDALAGEDADLLDREGPTGKLSVSASCRCASGAVDLLRGFGLTRAKAGWLIRESARSLA